MTRFAVSHFCDDVRAELGNKLSVMGIYSGELIVPATPFVLPKLCCVISCITPADQKFSTLKFRLAIDDADIAQGEMPPELMAGMAQQVLSRGSGDDPVSRYSLSFTLVVSPFLISKSHVIKAYANADGQELAAGRLYVTAGPATK